MIQICNIAVMENPCKYLQPFQFKITFIIDKAIKSNEYEWKIIYVGSSESKDFDQVLLSESVGAYCEGQHDLILRSGPIDPDKIPKEELVAPSVVLLVGYHNQKQFFQVGYIVVNEYLDDLVPDIIDYDKLQRSILENKPRIILDDENAESANYQNKISSEDTPNIENKSIEAVLSAFQEVLESQISSYERLDLATA